MQIEQATYTDSNGIERSALAYVLADGGDAPGSIYGTRCERWAHAAIALYDMFGEPTLECLESAIGAVVNATEPIEGLEEYEER